MRVAVLAKYPPEYPKLPCAEYPEILWVLKTKSYTSSVAYWAQDPAWLLCILEER
jgi:hypothetical protein